MQNKAVVTGVMMVIGLSSLSAVHGATDQERLEIVERRLDAGA